MSMINEGVRRASEWIARLAYLNLLWLLFSLAGLLLVGLFPATVAGYQMMRDWLHRPESQDEPLFPRYWAQFRRSLLSANLWGYSAAAVGYLLFAGLSVSFAADGEPWQLPLVAVSVIAAVVFLGVVVHLPFLLAHVEARPRELVRASWFYAMAHPVGTVIIVGVVVGLSFLLGAIPAATVFFLFSPVAAVTVVLDLRGFGRVQARQAAVSAG